MTSKKSCAAPAGCPDGGASRRSPTRVAKTISVGAASSASVAMFCIDQGRVSPTAANTSATPRKMRTRFGVPTVQRSSAFSVDESGPHSKRQRVYAQGFDLGLERLAWNAEPCRRSRGAGDPPSGLRERGPDQLPFILGERGHLAGQPFGRP